MSVDRRTVLKSSLAAAAVGGPFAGFVNASAGAVAPSSRPLRGLRAVRDARDGKVRLHVPKGFRYRSFHDTEQEVVLGDGTVLPGRHDGMGAFGTGDGPFTLVRNHEVNGNEPDGAFGPEGSPVYDPGALGGTTNIVVTRRGEPVVIDGKEQSWTSLSGTQMNCSGGVMPWGSWITCEETVNGPDVGPDFTTAPNDDLEKPHGYIFDVPANGTASAEPIRSAGRFAHEAVSWDGTHLYLTEDNFGFPSGFYRYTPPTQPGATGPLADGGTLEMLRVEGSTNATDNAHLEGHFERGAEFDVDWVTIEQPDFDGNEDSPTPGTMMTNNEAIVFVGDQGRAQGAAIFSRLEGQVWDEATQKVYFTSTQGGAQVAKSAPSGFGDGAGQVWSYHPGSSTLRMEYESPSRRTLDFPDNITTREGVLVLCEDGEDDNYLRALDPNGKLWNLAWNRLRTRAGGDRTDDEFAGTAFSPNGETLFFNIQASNGMSFAMWGDWDEFGF